MNQYAKPVQLVLSYMYISSLDALFMFGCLCSRHGFQCMLLIWIYQYKCTCLCTLFGINHTTR